MEADRARDVLALRMTAQGLAGEKATTAADAVRRLGCVQSQEHAHALWSLGLRTDGLSAADVAAEFDAGAFLRTHVLRPTWHFVAAEDLRWILATTSPRVQQTNGSQYRKIGLDDAALRRGADVQVGAIERAGRPLTRAELADALTAAGLPGTGLHLVCLVMWAELEALICSGPMRGNQHTYALAADRVPAAAPTEPDVAELARRFFAGHGPASVKDLCRWASLTQAQVTEALAALGDALVASEVDGVRLWAVDGAADPAPVPELLLLPLYDELPLSYLALEAPEVAGHPHPKGADLFVGSVIADGENVGFWRRVVKRTTVEVSLTLAPGVSSRTVELAERAAVDLAEFLGLRLVRT